MNSLLPARTVVREEVMPLLEKRNEDIRNDMNEMLHMGGEISCNGVKIEETFGQTNLSQVRVKHRR